MYLQTPPEGARHYPCLMGRETEAQRQDETCVRSASESAAELGTGPRSLASQGRDLVTTLCSLAVSAEGQRGVDGGGC